MKKPVLFCASILFSLIAIAQKSGQAYIDSAMPLVRSSDDSVKMRLYHGIANAYVHINPEKGFAYADSGIQVARRIGSERGKAVLYLVKANLLNDAGKSEEAVRLYNEVMTIVKKIDDRALIARTMNDIGGTYLRTSNYTKAIEWYSESLKIAETMDDPDMIGTALTNLSTIAYNQQDYPKAIAYNQQALPYFQKLGDPDKIARTYNYIGNSYFSQGKMAEAEKQFNEAMEMYRRTNNRTGIAILYSQIAILHEPDYRKIISYQLLSQQIWDSINPTHYNSIINLGNIGETYLNFIRADEGNKLSAKLRRAYLDTAEQYLNRAIVYSRQTNDIDNLSYFVQILAEQQALKGDYKSALESYQYGYGLRDSLFSQQNKNTIAGIESRREIELRDKQLEINRIELKTQRNLRIAMIAGMILLLAIAILIYRQSVTRKRTNTTLLQLNNQLDEANQVKARFFAILSHDLRSPVASLISFLEIQNQQPGLMTEEQAKAHQAAIAASARSLLETMESMLLWSKGQMENFKPEFRMVPVSQLFSQIRSLIPDTETTRIKFADPGETVVYTDENYLQTIMHNLTSNAIKALQYQRDGLVEWEVGTVDGKIILSVTDNGPGIKQEEARALYEETTVANSKTGFGMHLIRDLSQAIKYKIRVEPGKVSGTRFTLSPA